MCNTAHGEISVKAKPRDSPSKKATNEGYNLFTDQWSTKSQS